MHQYTAQISMNMLTLTELC